MPVGDIELVRYRSLSDISDTNSVRPAQREASVVECGASFDLGISMLKLSKPRLTVGDSVTVYWDIHETCCANDWIGLFDIDSPKLLTNYLDYKQRGVTGAKRGAIKWVVSRSVNFNKVENKCIFKYIHANTNTIRAVSPALHVHNPYAEIQGSGGRHNVHISQDTLNELSVSGLTAFGLKKNIFGKPSPYVKLSIIPSRRHFRSWKHHHGQIAKTSSQSHTINPNWQNEEFVFIGGNDDILEVEVRNKFSGTRPAFSRFLGKLSLPLCDLLERNRQVPECAVNKALCKRTPSDRIQGRIRFLITTMNTNHTALGSQDVTDQENTRPSNLNLLPSTSRASTMMAANSSLRSSAPDLLDLTSTPGSSSSNLQNSPVSPYGSHLDEEDDANNRRRIRDCRPFSEFYSEEFVPLDLDISSPRHRPVNANIEHNEHQINNASNGTDAANNSATTQSTESLDNRQDVPEERTCLTTDGADSIPDSVESPRTSPVVNEVIVTSPGVYLPDEETLDESESPMETVDLEVEENVVMEEDSRGVNDGVQEIEEIEDNEAVNLIHSTPSIRASVASIELTEDSPLRMMEESEQAQDEEATFSPHDAEDSDGMDDDDQFVYSNDGDDEMESERLTPDEDTNSVTATVISVDSWTYEGSQSSLDENMEGASGSSPPTYVRSSISANGLSSEERNSDEMDSAVPVAQVSDNEPVVSALVGSATAGESDALMPTENQVSEESEIGESPETIETTNQVSATGAEISPDRQLSLVETVDEIIGNDDVNEATSDPHSTVSATHSTAGATHSTVSVTHVTAGASHSTAGVTHSTVNDGQTPDEHPTNVQCVPVLASRSSRTSITRQELFNQIDLSSVAFPMEEAEPDIMDVTPIQSSSTAQLVVNTRPNRVFETNAEFTRRDDARASTRSEGQIVFDDTPTRPARRPKNISRSMSDSRGVRLNNRPERPERTRRRRTETEPRSTIVAFSHEGPVSTFPAIARPVTPSGNATSVTRDSAVTSRKERLRSSVSDPIVVAVPVSSHSPRSRAESYDNAIIASAIPAAAAVSVTPLPSPTLESESRSSVSSEVDTVVAVPVSSAAYTQSEAMSPVHVVTTVTVSSPKGTATNVTPIPSPGLVHTNHTRAVPMRQRSRDEGAPKAVPQLAAAAPPPTYYNSSSSATTTLDNAHPGAIPKPDSADMDRENITRMLRTYVRSAQVPQRPNQTNDPRLRKPSSEERPAAVEERGRPPRHDSSSSSRRRSSRQQRQQGERSHSHRDRSAAQPVHLQIQDDAENRNRRENVEQPLPSNWERGVDSHGRVYYIDHLNRTTTWSRPTREAPQNETNMNDINTHWQSLDRRYQSFRRTLRGRNRQSRVPLPDSVLQNQSNESTTANASSTDTASRPGTTRPVSSVNTPVQSESLPRPPPPSSSSTPQPANTSTASSATPTTYTTHSSSTASSSRPPQAVASSSRSRSGMSSSARSAALLESPAVKFITRPDFVDFIKTSGVAGQYYFQSQMLKLIINKVRADPVQFEKYRHQVELVRFLNQFADPQVELSPGWDKKVDLNGRSYFIDHSTRTTTFIDPRLPINGTVRRHRASTETEPRRSRAPPPRPPPPRGHSRENSTDATATPTLTYNQQVIGFLSQPNIEEIIARKQPSYLRNMALKANIRRAQCEGERTLERLSNNVDFVMLLSLFEDDIMSFVPPEISQKAETSSPCSSLPPSPVRSPPATNRMSATDSLVKVSGGASSVVPSPAPYRRDFEAKVRSFHRQLYHKGYGQGPNKIKMAVRRDRLLEDAYDQIMKETSRSLQRNRLEIQFAGEEGLDYGGPAREFFFLISRQIFNPYYGLFEYSANDTYTVQVSPVSLYVDNSHEWFRFCGRLVALVVIHQHLLDAFFTRTFYKSLLRSACDLSDVESLDALFHQSMMWVIENNIEDVLDLTFSVSEEIFGQVTERELIPGGKDIAVTEANKDEYVNEMVKWRVERGVSEQMESIVRGFNEVIDPSLVSIFDARELELVISGTADIDIKDWRRNTEYRSGYHDSHKVVKWFWKSVSSFDNEQRLRLLQFVTGTSSIPYEGFAALRGSTGPRKFSIERWGEYTKLPRAHTCFNRLDLPVYRSYDELLEKLTFAVEETGTFSIQ